MAETLLGAARGTSNGDSHGTRSLRRRRALPGGRAVVGGFLVALAAVGVFAGYTNATADSREPFLVARQDLAIGHRITRADLGTLPLDLPAPLRGRSYRDASRLIGSTVIAPLSKGELIQSSAVVAGPADGSADRQIAFAIDSARALDGRLRRGEFVDVIATYGTGAEAYTVVVVSGARVADRSEPRGALSDSGNEVITLSLPAAADSIAVAHAVNAGEVTLVRSSRPEAGAGAAAIDPAPAATTTTTVALTTTTVTYETPPPIGGGG